ncbi:MAG TPA: hypothetical protein VK327_11930 [Candidatus Paceibacterota bacterium]|nr:hypothetical protein [Candidatus Paceibacterota bacterium]
MNPYLQQLDDPDPQKVEESIERILKLIVKTYAELRPDSAEHPNFQFHPGANLLVVIGQPDALEVAQKCINALQQPLPGFPNGSAPSASSYSRPNSKERRELLKKLETIRLDSVAYDGLPLSEVVRHLVEVSKKLDPEKRGLNFLINPNQPLPLPKALPPVDPTTGLPAPAESIDINSISVRIIPALVNVRLIDALDAIVKVADHPIRYSVTDYAIVFSLSAPGVAEDRPMPPGAFAR